MWMSFHSKRRSAHCSKGLGLILIPVLLMTGCSTHQEISQGANVQSFRQKLASQPQVCTAYRANYVAGFEQNVAALSRSDNRMQEEAADLLAQSKTLLYEAGLSPEDCSRPYCIIEPLQEGKLDSWCGYRLDADQGEELYQWLDWETVQSADVR